jgi:nicotinic acid phosphoribosyltransferase
LDSGAIRQWVAKRHPELHNVRTALDNRGYQPKRVFERRVSRGYVGN